MSRTIKTQWLGTEYDLDELKEKYGTVEHEGKTFYLTDCAYAENYGTDGDIRYYAGAIDEEGFEYRVVWKTVEGWTDHRVGEDGNCVVEGCNMGWCSDESNACDWDDIYTVERI